MCYFIKKDKAFKIFDPYLGTTEILFPQLAKKLNILVTLSWTNSLSDVLIKRQMNFRFSVLKFTCTSWKAINEEVWFYYIYAFSKWKLKHTLDFRISSRYCLLNSKWYEDHKVLKKMPNFFWEWTEVLSGVLNSFQRVLTGEWKIFYCQRNFRYT